MRVIEFVQSTHMKASQLGGVHPSRNTPVHD
jgi:hypothetical protein